MGKGHDEHVQTETQVSAWRPNQPLGEALPVRILRAREAVMQFYRPLFKVTGITERQWRVLRNLYVTEFIEPSDLAKQSFMQAPNVSRVLSELLKLGYVERIADSKDQRRARVTLTPAGRNACIEIGKLLDERTRGLMGVVDQSQIEQLGALLEMVIDLPQKHPHLLAEPD